MHYTENLRPKVVPFSGFRHITVYYIHNEKYSPNSYVVNFHTQISSSQREERTMVFTREKMIRPIRIANDVFSRVKRMIRPRQFWILNFTPWNPDHRVLDSRFPVSVEVGFKIPIVSGIPDFLSCIADSTNKQKFPGFWKLY